MKALLPVVRAVFEPLHLFLDEIEKEGTMSVVEDQVVLDDPMQGGFVEMTEATEGLIDFFEIWMRRTGKKIDMSGLKQLVARVKYDAPITPAEVKLAKKSVKQMQFAMMNMRASEVVRLSRDTAIKHRIMA